MNIFVSSSDPLDCATILDDKRLIKMILETAQLLCTTLNLRGIQTPYKSTHVNHPCRKWIDESDNNYTWLYTHFICLCYEYTFRFNKKHACEKLNKLFLTHVKFNKTELTPFKNCTIFKDIEDVHEAYRKALIKKWDEDKRPPKWTKCKPPNWYKENV